MCQKINFNPKIRIPYKACYMPKEGTEIVILESITTPWSDRSVYLCDDGKHVFILLPNDVEKIKEEKQMAKVINNGCTYMNRREFIPEKYLDRYRHNHIPDEGATVQILDKVSWRRGSRDIEAYVCDDGGRMFLIDVKGVSLKEEKGVQIKIEKILKAGEQWVKVLDVQGLLKKEELPTAYVKESTAMWLGINPPKRVLTKSVFANDVLCVLEEGREYPLTEFREAIKDIRKAGKLLSRIKAEQAKRNANWHGEAVIKI